MSQGSAAVTKPELAVTGAPKWVLDGTFDFWSADPESVTHLVLQYCSVGPKRTRELAALLLARFGHIAAQRPPESYGDAVLFGRIRDFFSSARHYQTGKVIDDFWSRLFQGRASVQAKSAELLLCHLYNSWARRWFAHNEVFPVRRSGGSSLEKFHAHNPDVTMWVFPHPEDDPTKSRGWEGMRFEPAGLKIVMPHSRSQVEAAIRERFLAIGHADVAQFDDFHSSIDDGERQISPLTVEYQFDTGTVPVVRTVRHAHERAITLAHSMHNVLGDYSLDAGFEYVCVEPDGSPLLSRRKLGDHARNRNVCDIGLYSSCRILLYHPRPNYTVTVHDGDEAMGSVDLNIAMTRADLVRAFRRFLGARAAAWGTDVRIDAELRPFCVLQAVVHARPEPPPVGTARAPPLTDQTFKLLSPGCFDD